MPSVSVRDCRGFLQTANSAVNRPSWLFVSGCFILLSFTAAEHKTDRKVEVAVGFFLQFVIECKAQSVEQFHADTRHKTA